jgi:uncharacterized protein YjbI with pentapeptide repeats
VVVCCARPAGPARVTKYSRSSSLSSPPPGAPGLPLGHSDQERYRPAGSGMRPLPSQRRQRERQGAATVEEQRRRGAWVRSWPLLAVTVAGLVVGYVLVFPRLLYPPLSSAQLRVRGVDNPKDQVQLQNDRLKLQNDARTTLLQAVGGLLVLSTAAAGAYTAWQQLKENQRQQQHNEQLTREELRLTRESHIVDRFTKAIEQLGSDKLDVRLGGIYALERIAKDSERDHPTVVEVLSAFVREESRKQSAARARQGVGQEAAKADTPAPDSERAPRPATDVQAALTVLARLPLRPGVPRADLSEAKLSHARLNAAQLYGAQLGGADLSHAVLFEANLSGAQLVGANLAGAWLEGANLAGAVLISSNLTDARLSEADLSHAVLYEANLSGAQLGGANLSDASIGGTDLSKAVSLTQAQLDRARGNVETRVPDGLHGRIRWILPGKE